jgi:drug/metabolite transporter (DMT)-like permease
MSTLAIVLVVISAGMHAVRNFLTKKAHDKKAFVWLYELFGITFFLPLLVFYLYREGFPSGDSLYFIAASGFLHFLYWLFLAKSLDRGELSHVYPIMRSSPAPVLVFSVLVLNETVSLTGLAGIGMVAVGVYMINLRGISLRQVLEPISSIRTERPTQLAFLTLVSVTAYSLVDKAAVSRMHPVIFAGLYPWLSMLFFTPFIAGKSEKNSLQREWKAHRLSILACGFLGIFGYFLILLALSFERVSYVVGMRQISVVFAVLLGAGILNEDNRWIRLFASIIIFFGTFTIAIAK